MISCFRYGGVIFLAVLSFLSFRTEAIKAEEITSSIPEIQQKEGSDRCSHDDQSLDNFESDYLEAFVASQWLAVQTVKTDGCRNVEEPLPEDCSDVKSMISTTSGVYSISVNDRPVEVYCDFNTPGGDWLVFQRRKDGSVDFYRNWTSYANGFGNANGEFWLGNEILNHLTSSRRYKLRIDLEDFENQRRFAEYSTFSVGPLSDYYRLRIGNYSGDAGDALAYHNNGQFSTYDVDRDSSPGNCASYHKGAWWFAYCHHCDLNGRYYSRGADSGKHGVTWFHFGDQWRSLKTAEMKITRQD